MKDRIPLHPGRVKLVPVEGQTNVYDLTRADEPYEVGTPLNKATFFSDETAQAFGLIGDRAVPDEGLKLSAKTFNNLGNIHTWRKIATDTGEAVYYVSHERDGYQEGGEGNLPAEIRIGRLLKEQILAIRDANIFLAEAVFTDSIKNVIIQEDNSLEIINGTPLTIETTSQTTAEALIGKYFKLTTIYSRSDLNTTDVYYVPGDAVIQSISNQYGSGYSISEVNKMLIVGERPEFTWVYLGRIGDSFEIVTGAYTGDDTEDRTIMLPFTPKGVLVMGADGATLESRGENDYNHRAVHGGLALPDYPVILDGHIALKIVEKGFIVTVASWQTNYYARSISTNSGVKYYIAII